MPLLSIMDGYPRRSAAEHSEGVPCHGGRYGRYTHTETSGTTGNLQLTSNVTKQDNMKRRREDALLIDCTCRLSRTLWSMHTKTGSSGWYCVCGALARGRTPLESHVAQHTACSHC